MPDKLFCPHCGAPAQPADRFCPSCGRKRESSTDEQQRESSPAAGSSVVVCRSCGVRNSSGGTNCFACGSPLESVSATGTAPRQNAPVSGGKKIQGKKRLSFTMQLIIAFAALAAIIAVIESQNAPTVPDGGAQQQQAVQPAAPDNDLLQTIMLLENAVKADSANAGAILQLANVLHDARMFPRAIESYKAYIRRMPKATDAIVDLGICFFETGDAETAVKEIKKALAIDPKHQMAMFNLGVILLSSGKADESKEWLQKTIDIDPQSLAGQRAKEILHQH